MSEYQKIELKCPRCKSITFGIVEHWRATSSWAVENGRVVDYNQNPSSFDLTGELSGVCPCGHEWKIRKKLDLEFPIKVKQ